MGILVTILTVLAIIIGVVILLAIIAAAVFGIIILVRKNNKENRIK